MRHLREGDAREDLTRVTRAWERAETFALLPDKTGLVEGWLEAATEKIPPEYAVGHFGLLTSGSTGLPKLVVGSRERAEQLARLLHELQESEDVAESVLLLPLSYSYAFVNQWLWARLHRRRLVTTRGFADPALLAAALRNAERAMVCMVGGQVALLEQLGDETFPQVSRLHFAGGPFPQSELETLRGRFPRAQIFNNYGCAEAMPRLALRRAEDSDLASNIGRPLPGIELSTSESGELLFRSPFSAIGWVDAGGWHTVEAGAWVHTGDLGVRRESGSWEVHGRVNEVFKRYGEKIALPIVKATVLSVWRGGAAFYLEHDRASQEGHVLVLAPRPDPSEVRTILRALRARHTRPHWPLRIESVKSLPLLPNGKVDLRSLAASEERMIHWDQRS